MILPQVIEYLVTTFRTVTAFPVFDGPVPAAANQPDAVLVGSAGDDDVDGIVVERPASDLGPGTWREEIGEILCSAWSWDGGDNMTARRSAAVAAAEACIAAVESDRSLGGLLTPPRLAEVLEVRYLPLQSPSGAIVRVIFTVTYRTLVT